MHYYTFHINDYRSGTMHLTNGEDLAYRRMLDLYYEMENPLPLDEAWIARRVRCERADVVAVLADMFVRTDAGFVNKRAEKEIVKTLSMLHRERKHPPMGLGGEGGHPPGGWVMGNGEMGISLRRESPRERRHPRSRRSPSRTLLCSTGSGTPTRARSPRGEPSRRGAARLAPTPNWPSRSSRRPRRTPSRRTFRRSLPRTRPTSSPTLRRG